MPEDADLKIIEAYICNSRFLERALREKMWIEL